MEENQEHQHHWALIVLSIAIVAGMVYLGWAGYQQTSEDETQQILLAHEQEIKKLKEEVDLLRFESEGQTEELKKKLAQEETLRQVIQSQRETQEQISKQKLDDLEVRLAQTQNGNSGSLASVIQEWQSRVAYVDCDFVLPNTLFHYGTSGSGVVVKLGNDPVKILTNKHVVTSSTLHKLSACSVTLPERSGSYYVPSSQIEVSSSGYDWGVLTISESDQYLEDLTAQSYFVCDQKPSLGDEIIVLGYPGIGSTSSVTATEGIISGFDGSYFITSAKVEEGNSGGAAILIKDNCLLGIPTFATLGEVESLARILDIWTVITK